MFYIICVCMRTVVSNTS